MSLIKTRLFITLALASLAVASQAQTTGGGVTPPDLSPVATAASTQFVSFFTTNAPALISILLAAAAFKMIVRFIRGGSRA